MSKHDQKTRHVGLAHVAQPSYLALTNFGEVSTRATIRCCVRCWGPFGLAQLLGGERSRGTRDPTVGSEVLPYSLGGADAQERDPPLVSGRWRVLDAALRRAIASRKAVPADVKDQLSAFASGKVL